MIQRLPASLCDAQRPREGGYNVLYRAPHSTRAAPS